MTREAYITGLGMSEVGVRLARSPLGLTLEGRAIYTGEQQANALNTVQLGSWTRFDAGVRYAFEADGRPLTARVRIENVANQDHWVAVGGYPGANYLTLGAPRTLSLQISAEF